MMRDKRFSTGTVEGSSEPKKTGATKVLYVLTALAFIGVLPTARTNPESPTVPEPGEPGDLDTSFLATGAGAGARVYSVAVQADGKILIGGYFTTCNDTARGYVARLWN